MIDAPSSISSSTRSIARDASNVAPASENESGVVLTTPMSSVRPCVIHCWIWLEIALTRYG